jgi:GGDEF domain-containing protein
VLLERAAELARRWVIALIRERPLDGIGELPLDELAHEAPSLCAQALQAMQSDVELARLTGRGTASARADSAPARRLATIAGAHDAAGVVEAVEALRGVLWEALLDQMTEPSARQVGDAADRLAHICSAALAVALDAGITAGGEASIDDAVVAVSGSEPGARDLTTMASSGRQAIIVDERTSERPLSWDESSPLPPGARPAEIEIRDERREDGPAAWIKSIGARLEAFEHDRLPFAVLLVELREVERLHRDGLSEDLSGVLASVERALTGALGSRAGSLTRERPGRYWLLMPGTDRAGARALAERLEHAVASCASDRTTPLDIAIGTAVCPEDGLEAAALAAHADVGLYAERSALRASASRSAAIDESI